MDSSGSRATTSEEEKCTESDQDQRADTDAGRRGRWDAGISLRHRPLADPGAEDRILQHLELGRVADIDRERTARSRNRDGGALESGAGDVPEPRGRLEREA